MDFVNKKELEEILLSEMNEKEMIQAVLDLSDEDKSREKESDLIKSSYSSKAGSDSDEMTALGEEENSQRLRQLMREQEQGEGIGREESKERRRVIVIKTRDGKSKTFLVKK
jgi:hypothetical protein